MKHISMKTMSLLTAAALTLSLASCAGQTASSEQDSSAVAESSVSETVTKEPTSHPADSPAPQSERNQVIGQITSVDGTTVTVALGDMSQMKDGRNRHGMAGVRGESEGNQRGSEAASKAPEDAPPEMPTGQAPANEDKAPAEVPDGEPALDSSNTPSEMPSEEMPQGDRAGSTGGMPGKMGGFTASGETVSIQLSLITQNGEPVTSEDLSEGALLEITLDDNGDPVSAQMMTMGHGGMRGGPDSQGNMMQGSKT